MKDLDPPDANAVNGGLMPRQTDEKAYDEQVDAKAPAPEVDYIPAPHPR